MALTLTSDVTWDAAAYNLYADYALRRATYFDSISTVKPTAQSMQGATVSFGFHSDLSIPASYGALTENVDVTPVAMGNSFVIVTLAEYGNVVGATAAIRGTSMVPLDPAMANVTAYNAAVTRDELIASKLMAGTYRQGANDLALASIDDATTATMRLRATEVRKGVAQLRTRNAMGIGGAFRGFLHPYSAMDLREETGAAAWRDPHTYSQPGEIWNGEIGEFEGVRFSQTSATPLIQDNAGATNTDVYACILVGDQSLCKAYSNTVSAENPQIVISPVTDKLRRNVHIGWYWLGGYAIYRQASVIRLEHAVQLDTD